VTPVAELVDVSKDYRGLRPLRIARLTIEPGARVAVLGLDQPAAEVLVNLITGAALPDRGEIRVFGSPTAAIADSGAWLALLDRFGIASDRAVLLDQFSVIQNLAVPFTLEIEPPPDDVRRRAEALAVDVGIAAALHGRVITSLDGAARARVRLARALALDPALVIVEHLTAAVARSDVRALAADVRAAADRRGAALLVLTADAEFARRVADRVLVLEPATGRLAPAGLRGWLQSRLG
jgi:ABC-type transporter Mla maintaining outer membrane lipid asymmetry ATPase subunit MlaF